MAKRDKELEIDEEFGAGVVEEPEDSVEKELEEAELPEQEEQILQGRGDGHRPVTDISDEKQAAFEEHELEKTVPGRGHLFRIPKKHLHEATELNEAEIFSFAIGDVQRELYNYERTEGVFDILKYAIMGYRVSLKRQGRKEDIIAGQLTAEEKQAAADGGLLDRP
jgi:hypothetical protein